MDKSTLLLAVLLLLKTFLFGQGPSEKMVFVIDSIQVVDDPEEGNDLSQNDVADLQVITNKDTLANLGYGKFDGITYIFTKAYRNRSESLKQIPSLKQLEFKDGVFLFHNAPYSGQFIDYYYNGKKQGDGKLLGGKADGHRKMYYPNGKVSVERDYKAGIEDGLEIEYYQDGTIKQKGEFVHGKENGIWDMYFPNGQLKQRSNFINGQMDGETTVYYSTGKVLAVEVTKNGKTKPDKSLEKIKQAMNKARESSKEEDYKSALKSISKAIEIDSTYAEAYFSRGTIMLNDFKFDEAILDFDRALQYEPFMAFALSNRAFARIRKYQFGGSRTILKNSNVTVLASKDKLSIPDIDKVKICNDLQKAIFLGDKSKMVIEAVANYCNAVTSP